MNERRWTPERFDKRLQERMAEGKIRGGAEEGRAHLYFAAVMADMVEDYEAELANHQAALRQRDERIDALQGEFAVLQASYDDACGALQTERAWMRRVYKWLITEIVSWEETTTSEAEQLVMDAPASAKGAA